MNGNDGLSEVKVFRSGSIVVAAGGGTTNVFERSFNGTILTVRDPEVTLGDGDSFTVFVSGTDEQIMQFQANEVRYPFVYGVDNTGTTGSPHAVTNRVLNGDVLQFQLIMLSDAATVSGVSILYV